MRVVNQSQLREAHLEQLVEVGLAEGAELGQVHFVEVPGRRGAQGAPQRTHHLQHAHAAVVGVFRGGGLGLAVVCSFLLLLLKHWLVREQASKQRHGDAFPRVPGHALGLERKDMSSTNKRGKVSTNRVEFPGHRANALEVLEWQLRGDDHQRVQRQMLELERRVVGPGRSC
jgi:hypothetical protein